MRRFILSFVLALLSVLSQAQKGESVFGVDAMLRNYRIESSERTVLQTGLKWGWQLHHLRVAPIFQLYSSEARNKQYGFAPTGLSLAYQLQVPSQISFLQQSFEVESSSQVFFTEWTASQYSPALNAYEDIDFKSREFFQSITLGYGFTLLAGDHLYLSPGLAAGIYLSSLSGGPVNDEIESRLPVDFRGYDDFGSILNISLAIGYTF